MVAPELESSNLIAPALNGKAREVSGDWLTGEVCVETEDLYADYADTMKQMQERYPKAENMFGMFLRGVFRPWSEQNKEEWPIKKRDKSVRRTYYRLPKLEDCRKAFEMYTKVSWEWPKEEEMPL